jgi:hypothetical protein
MSARDSAAGMARNRRHARCCAIGAVLLGVLAPWVAASPPHNPASVRIIESSEGYRLLVNGEPFRVQGGGLESGSQQELAARGGNAFRTWRTGERAEAVLDQASANGLMVAMGIEMGSERHGFDYDDPSAVARQFARVRAQVLRNKDHPALLLWIVGNELNLESRNPRVWNAVDRIAQWIHQVDPNHPVMTTLAGFDGELAALLKARAPALDLIGIQLYGDIEKLPLKLEVASWTGPYMVTEWGPTGHWEVPKTAWGAPIEDDSTRKAQLLIDRYQRFIDADQRQCLGSFVFLWGQKQERTPTWYGLFLDTGEATAGVDAMQFLWTGRWPENRSPSITPIRIEGRAAASDVFLQPGQKYSAQIEAADTVGDALSYRWTILHESTATTTGGDREDVPHRVKTRMSSSIDGTLEFDAPAKAGNYRLLATVLDGHGHAAHANIPFAVAASK